MGYAWHAGISALGSAVKLASQGKYGLWLHMIGCRQWVLWHAGALVAPVQQGTAPAEAASLLASIVKGFGPDAVGQAPAAKLPGGGRVTGGSYTICSTLFQPSCCPAVECPSLVKFGQALAS